MNAYVFVGPTLPREKLSAFGDIVCLPPVAQGDVYRVAQAGARAIGLIDGYFEGVPAVWHKEILWALSQGIAVFGSASMGALRAAELSAFGMRGVGRIFEAYRAGTLVDDDEVAVQHGPSELGYVALSEPMVNIRATLDRAVAEDVIDRHTHGALAACAKNIFYQDRTWDALFAAAEVQSVSSGQLRRLVAWLPDGRVDQKADDATAMLSEMTAWLGSEADPDDVDFDFEWTDAWETAITAPHRVDADPARQSPGVTRTEVLAELRLDPEAYHVAKAAALARLLALRGADRMSLEAGRHTMSDVLARLRSRHGLYRRADLERWMRANDLSEKEMERLIDDEARLEGYTAVVEPALEGPLFDHLRMGDAYRHLADRALKKRDALADITCPDPDAETLGLQPPQLLLWYFEGRLGRPAPEDLDRYIDTLGLTGREEFYRLLAREYLFLGESEREDQSQ